MIMTQTETVLTGEDGFDKIKESSFLLEEESSEESQNEPEEKENCPCKCYHLGMLYAALSGLFFSLCAAIVKYMTNIHPIQMAFYRFVGIFIPAAMIAAYLRVNPFPAGSRALLLMRSVAGCLSLSLQYYAFQHMELGDASVIIFSNPVFVAIIARIVLKEQFTFVSVTALVTTILGVVLVVKPHFIFSFFNGKYSQSSNEFMGILAACISLIFSSTVYITLRLMRTLHFSAMLVTYGFISLIITATISISLNQFQLPSCALDYWLILTMAFLSFVGQLFLTFATKIEGAGPVALVRTSDIICAYLFQTLYFHEIPSMPSMIGMALVTVSVVAMGFHKWLKSLPEGSQLKLRCKWLA